MLEITSHTNSNLRKNAGYIKRNKIEITYTG